MISSEYNSGTGSSIDEEEYTQIGVEKLYSESGTKDTSTANATGKREKMIKLRNIDAKRTKSVKIIIDIPEERRKELTKKANSFLFKGKSASE